MPGSSLVRFLNAHFGRQITSIEAPGLANVRLSLEVMVGLVFLAAAVMLIVRRTNAGLYVGYFALLVSLAVLDLLLFYFEQFSSVLIVAFHFIILAGIMRYRRKFLSHQVGKLDVKA
jgi:hypothetical protein